MGQKIRKTGIDIVGDARWGTHFCQFYQSKEDLIDILVPYFKAGLENNEFCMWITSEPLSEKETKKAMRKAMPNFERYLTRGQIEIVPYSEWYLKDGAFNLQRVLKAWIDKLNQALARGYDGMRVTGNTAWLEKRDWRNFTDYEKEVNRVIGKYRMMAICTYSLDRCGAFELIDVVSSHQFALIRREGEWELMESFERKRTEETLWQSEDKFRNIYAESPIGIELYDSEGQLIDVNKACLDMFGVSDALEVKGFKLFDDPNVSDGVKERLHRGETVRYEAAFDFEKIRKLKLYKTTKSGIIYLDLAITPLGLKRKGSLGGYLVQIQDITERKKAEEALRKAHDKLEQRVEERTVELVTANERLEREIEERKRAQGVLERLERRYHELVEKLDAIIWEADAHTWQFTFVNQHAEKISGYPVNQWLSEPNFWADHIHPDDRKDAVSFCQRATQEGHNHEFEYRMIKADGSVVWLRDVVSVECVEGKPVQLRGIMVNITERKKTEEKIDAYQKRLRSLMSELTLTEERHRRRIATELHDSIGQLLALCQIKLGQLEKVIASPNSRPLLKEIGDSLEQVIRYTRSLTHQLSPFILYELGLEAALEWLAEFIYEQQGIQINLAVDSQANPVNEELRIFLFRAVQELLTNVTKHAKTDRAEVSLCRENESIRITIEDVGVGFNTAILDTPSRKDIGFGLFSIRERLKYFEGELSIQSKPGQGTQVTLTVPSKCHKKRSEGG